MKIMKVREYQQKEIQADLIIVRELLLNGAVK